MKKISIIDYGCGNILNLVRALKFIGYEPEITNEREKIVNSSHIILPGVGAFGNAMKQLEKRNLSSCILEYSKKNRPLLGICLGMQLLFSVSYEFGVHKGLGLIEGEVVKIANKQKDKIKIPHVGWNEIYPNKNKREWTSKILKNVSLSANFYFVHSFVALTKNLNSTIAISNYSGISIPAVVSVDNVFGCQFHPEKSSDDGLIILRNFCEI